MPDDDRSFNLNAVVMVDALRTYREGANMYRLALIENGFEPEDASHMAADFHRLVIELQAIRMRVNPMSFVNTKAETS